ncbi:MAG: DEAD/DEAH box helicase, partial [Armatimonadetes bacterium]|nr:DEAD/DEAH box helicase [Armatimonadota bacterium]
MALAGILPLLRRRPEYASLLAALRDSPPGPWAVGLGGAQKAFLLAGLLDDLHLPARGSVLVVTPTREAAERLQDDLLAFLPDLEGRVRVFPYWEVLPHDEMPPPAEVVGDRLALLHDLLGDTPAVILAPVPAVLPRVPDPDGLRRLQVVLRPGHGVSRDMLAEFLVETGYARADLVVTRGEFAVRGSIVDLFPSHARQPVRVEFFGDEIEDLRSFDPTTQRSTASLEEAIVLPFRDMRPAQDATVLDYLGAHRMVVLDEPVELAQQTQAVIARVREAEGRAREAGRDLHLPGFLAWADLAGAVEPLPHVVLSTLHRPDRRDLAFAFSMDTVDAFGGQTKLLAREMQRWREEGRRIVLASSQARRLAELFRDLGVPVDAMETLAAPPDPAGVVAVPVPLSAGFRLDDLVTITDGEVLGWRRHRRRRLRTVREGSRLASWMDLDEGDYVVHVHHGIGVYRGLHRLAVDGASREYLLLEYDKGDRLYVPVDQINLVQRYIGVEGAEPKVHRLGGSDWEREKRRAKEAAEAMARDLLVLHATRETIPGYAFASDTVWQQELEATFEYEETPDQRRAIEDVKRDMEQPRSMDRLIIGDVGYGKTEVAVRAAFKAILDGKQVAVLVPTTILAQQHANVFSQRFASYPVRVESVSRFRSPREQKRVLEDLRAGRVDLIIGTHRLLQPDVHFKDLGLVIVDEEQRFGVAHKERLKQLRRQVDVLTLTATPIPRTLHMSLVGLRDMSIIETPPEARQPIRTAVCAWDDDLVADAIRQEMSREGQVYVVHNRVETIERAARRIQALVPEARAVVAHGQMPEERLERVMLDFLGGRYDVLVCTTIEEIGLDIPRVTT